MSAVLVFDADDTLWMNEWQYSKAFADFFAYLYSQFGNRMPNFHALKTRYDEIDRELFPICGVRRGRVAEAMRKTYEEVLQFVSTRTVHAGFFGALEQDSREEQRRRIREIGDHPFSFQELRWVAFLERALDQIGRIDGNTLCLLTSYDEVVWKKKRRFLNIGRYFGRRVRAVPGKKTAEDFIAVSGYDWRPKGVKYYAIGNGTSDILPALEISDRWHGIYVPHGSTSALFENKKGESPYFPPPMDHLRVMNLRNILQIQSLCFEHFYLRPLWGNGLAPCPKCFSYIPPHAMGPENIPGEFIEYQYIPLQ